MTAVEASRRAQDARGGAPPQPPAVSVEGLWATYGTSAKDPPAIRGVTFEVEAGAFFALLGPSGCGKTTTLRCLAGLHRPYAGRLAIQGTEVYSAERRRVVPPDRRDLGMVFQSYALWPHMSALDNVAFPLKWGRRHEKKASARAAAAAALESVGLGHLGASYPWMLSGGQQQRVALARALVASPGVLLLDEPLSNLDSSLRAEMRGVLKEIISSRPVTAIYVTHDQTEALAMATRIAVMHEGNILESGTPNELYERPAHRFTARATGKANLLSGRRLPASSGGGAAIETAGGRLACPEATGGLAASGGGSATLAFFRPERASLERAGAREVESDGCTISGVLSAAAFVGQYVEYEVLVGAETISVQGSGGEGVVPGDRVVVRVAPGAVRVVVDTPERELPIAAPITVEEAAERMDDGAPS